jgi:AcrR family transcriptional regulator
MSTVRRRAASVKGPRRYNASLRRERAAQNRERIVEAAQRLFLRDGYGPTTVAAIADDAGVSVDTVFKAFGGKPGIIRGIRDRALRGEGPVPAEDRSDNLQLTEPDPRKIVQGWGRFVTELAPRSAPILLLLRDASTTDTELRALLDAMDADRLRRMTVNGRRLRRAGHLRDGVSVKQAADVLWTYSSPELYELLVLRRGMSVKAYGEFVAEAMTAALL